MAVNSQQSRRFAVAMLPFLGIGGMQIFQRENSDIDDKFMPKFNYIAKRIMLVYILLTAACTVSLYGVGMSWFDAANHAVNHCGIAKEGTAFHAVNCIAAYHVLWRL